MVPTNSSTFSCAFHQLVCSTLFTHVQLNLALSRMTTRQPHCGETCTQRCDHVHVVRGHEIIPNRFSALTKCSHCRALISRCVARRNSVRMKLSIRQSFCRQSAELRLSLMLRCSGLRPRQGMKCVLCNAAFHENCHDLVRFPCAPSLLGATFKVCPMPCRFSLRAS